MNIIQYARDNAWYGWGYLQGRSSALPTSFSDLYGQLIAKGTSLVTLPLPLLSFLLLPVFGGSSATINAFFFYLTWSSLVLSYGELKIEIYGTLVLRLVFFFIPALISLGFDAALPKQSKTIKARGHKHHPARLNRERLATVTSVALFNVLLAVALQGFLEVLCTKVLHLRSLIKVTKASIPFPWSIVRDLIQGFVVRGIVHYAVHRYLLHTYKSVLKTWHRSWQHGVVPFSLVAAYDHPVTYLLSTFVPTFLPAYLFRWHVLTWFIFVILTSLEDLFIYSGYSVLPSTILLTGMARRMEAHFESVKKRKPGDFGHIGVLDFVFGTSCQEESTVMDDFRDEAEKRRFQEHVEVAVHEALEGVDRKKKRTPDDADTSADVEEDEELEEDVDNHDRDTNGTSAQSSALGRVRESVAGLVAAPRRSGRRKGR